MSLLLSWTRGELPNSGVPSLLMLVARFHQISTFDHGTIQKFAANSSEMKRMAARDFEDLLQVWHLICILEFVILQLIFQCSIPAFEGLLEGEHNCRLMKLLYHTAEWHALAKLRIQTEGSLKLLDDLTTEFGQLLRQFRDLTCTTFTTVELPHEAEARERRRQEKNTTTSSSQADNKGGQGGQTRE